MTEAELNGLVGEVEQMDIYLMRETQDIVSENDASYIFIKGHPRAFNIVPDVIFDIGANVGVFSRYARGLFPESKIVSLEPDERNAQEFVCEDVIFLRGGVGVGKYLYHTKGAVNGTGECYLSDGCGYKGIDVDDNYTATDIPIYSISDLVKAYVNEGEKYIIKMDVEGAENAVFSHEPSMLALLGAEYFVCELHYYSLTHAQLEDVTKLFNNTLDRFSLTHKSWIENNHFYAVRF